MPLVHLDHVAVTIGTLSILQSIDLVVEAGERVGIAGTNGAGKSTLLRVVATLLPPSRGEGVVLEARLGTAEVQTVRRQIGLAGHEPTLYDNLTLEENLHHVARLAGLDPRHATTLLAQVGLEGASHRPSALASAGMRRRVDLARLLLIGPRLVLLDEAHAGLDDDSRIIVDEVIHRTIANGGAVVLVSHDGAALATHCDRVLRLSEGRLT